MPFARRTSPPRHLAGARHAAPNRSSHPSQRPADFDVAAALEPASGFDFEALFAADEAADDAGDGPRRRVPRTRVAFAASVTLAALPLLFLDNFSANASPSSHVDAAGSTVETRHLDPTGPPAEPEASDEAPATTVPQPVVFVAEPPAAPATTVAPTSTSTEAPAAPTTTVVAAVRAQIATVKAPTTTTTAKPAPTTTTTAKPAPTTTTVPPAPSTTVAARQAVSPDPDSDATWDRLAACESNGNWAADTGNGYYGGLQFSQATWRDLGGSGSPNDASRAEQIRLGRKLYDRSGWGAWPGCQRKLGWS